MVPSTPQQPDGPRNGLGSSLPTGQTSPDILLVIFIHGFKGDDTTFGDFPLRLQHILSESAQGMVIESIVFPAYETRGDLDKAVERFADWLTTLTVQKEVAHSVGGGSSRAKIVLCGHSMGGLLAADSIREFIHTRPDIHAPLWPNIIACLAFDTPYLGLHPHVFKNSANKATEYVQNVHKTASGLWGAFSQPKANPATPVAQPAGLLPPPAALPASSSGRRGWGPAALAVGGALMAGALAGTAYYHRADIETSYGALTQHMQYVGALWDEGALTERVHHLVEGETMHGVVFRTFYTLIPPSPPANLSPRTFCLLPETSSDAFQRFVPAPNTLAENEVRAHVTMFEPTKNDGYYQLGLEAAAVIRQAITNKRPEVHTTPIDDQTKETDPGGIYRQTNAGSNQGSDLLL
ncbi:hypothetical protein BGY98DRAFT_948864 [Russula aff. rugulosa BPL654]|nr:hypothetical protein BGY98DRAFT_948864 [Russula aff. rugulosa BPL654]